MRTELYWIEGPSSGRLAIMPRPRGGDWLEDEVRAWREAGVNVILSLLTPSEVTEFDLVKEETLCTANGIQFFALPIPDRGVPASPVVTLAMAADLANRLREGKNVAIHCRQGIGRAPLIAIAVLVHLGLDTETATAHVAAARGCPVPETIEQKRWIAASVGKPMALAPK